MEYVLDNPIIFKFLREIEEEYNRITNYIDVTDEWINGATPNSHTIKDLNYWIHNGIKYYVDGKNVVLDYSDDEKKCAQWLEDTLGGKVYMCPRINNPKGVSTPDYLFRNEYWDLKRIVGKGNRTIDTSIKKCKNQSQNFVIDIDDSDLTLDEVICQINKIYSNKDRKWVNKIILKKSNNIIKVYKKRD